MTAIRSPRPFTADDLCQFGRRFGIRYRFPSASVTRSMQPEAVVAGDVTEFELRPDMRLTDSCLEVLHRYESDSLRPSPLFLVMVLEGQVGVRLGDRHALLNPGSAMTARLGERARLHAIQAPGQRLRTLNLSLGPVALSTLAKEFPSLAPLLGGETPLMHTWQLPPHLLAAAQSNLELERQDPRHSLLIEGLSLQLLAHGLPTASSPADRSLSPCERQRLETVREVLHETPEHPHSLAELAKLAAMSPSTLRSKFRRAYGNSVFGYLQECRLSKARQYLAEGYSVQQTAHLCGYRHATNFATAFRRRFGYPPSSRH
ncbi:MAG: helix-turn-helix transcriptional regulator [Pseudomonadota bacterium]